MSHTNDNSQNIRFAIFNCPEELTEEQKQEIRNFAEYVEKQQKDPEKQKTAPKTGTEF